jgi:guanylate kinase
MKSNFKNPSEKIPSDGKKLFQLLSGLDLKSLRIRKEYLGKLKNINSIIIIGSSWSGKTTVRNTLNQVGGEYFSFPKRVITREQRPNDNLDENEFAQDLDELKIKVDGGLIWKRDLGEKTEYYGFKKPEAETFPIYSANNALIRGRDDLIKEPQDLVSNSLILLVYAPDDEREDRNKKREGDYLDTKPLQKEVRASDRAISMYPEAHILVKNSNDQDLIAQKEDLGKILNAIRELRK